MLALLAATALTIGASPATARAEGDTGTISGTVTGGGGEILESVSINACRVEGASSVCVAAAFPSAQDMGHFELQVPPGTYRVSFYSQATGDRWFDDVAVEADAALVEVIAGAITQITTDLTLLPAVSGRVIDTSWVGTANAYICLEDKSTYEFKQCGQSDSQGLFSIPVTPGAYLMKARADGYPFTYFSTTGSGQDRSTATVITVDPGETVKGRDIQLVAGGYVAGTVTAAGQSLQDASVHDAAISIYGEYGGFWYPLTYMPYSYLSSGEYRLALAPGLYRLWFGYATGYRSEWFENASELDEATAIEVKSGDTRTVDVDLAVPRQISGTVTTASRAVAGARVCAQRVASTQQASCTISRSDGTYALDDLDAAEFTLELTADGYLTAYWAESGTVTDEALAGAIDLTSALTQTKDVALTPVSTIDLAFTTVPPPRITGEPRVGSTLSVDAGNWDPSPTSLIYTWFRDESAIGGATDTSYGLTTSDVGKTITVTVTAIKDGYQTTTTTSAGFGPVGRVVLSGATPSISGDARLGGVLTASIGAWSPVAPNLQWKRGGLVVGAGSTYQVQLEDCGAALTVTATATSPGSSDLVKTSASKVIPLAEFAAPVPWLSGNAKLGASLTANLGTWPNGTKLDLQWNRGGNPVAGRTATTYLVGLDDLGQPLTVTVTGSRAHYANASRTSGALTPNTLSLSTTPTPKIKGKAKAGSKLAASVGTWGPAPVKLKYEWLRSKSVIPGATGTTYRVQAADGGSNITFRVTGSKTGYRSVARVSASTKSVPLSKLRTATSKIKGTPKVGGMLTVSIGKWTSGTTFAYQWLRAGKAVAGATRASYALTAADRGKAIKVKVTGTKQGYKTVAKTSKATRKVK